MNSPTYSDTDRNTNAKYPEIKVTLTGKKQTIDETVITLDATGAHYKSYADKKARINGVKLGTEQGIVLKANTKYTVSFLYRLDEIKRPVSSDEYDDTTYSLRTPVIQVYKDGKNPTSPMSNVNPWSLTVGEWNSYSFEFTTDSTLSGDTWFSLVSFASMKSGYKDFKIAEGDGEPVQYGFGNMEGIPEKANMNSPTYSDTDRSTNAKYPEIKVTLDNPEQNQDVEEETEHCLKIDASAWKDGNKPMASILTEREIKKDTAYTVEFDYFIKTNSTEGNAFGFIRDKNGNLGKSMWASAAAKGEWKHVTRVYSAKDIVSVNNPNSFFQFVILSKETVLYIDNFSIKEHKVFDENNIPGYQTEDFEENISSGGAFGRADASSLASTVSSNGSDGYLCADNAKMAVAVGKAEYYKFKGIEFKSNTTYRISIEYYVAAPYSNVWHCAFGYDSDALGCGTGVSPVKSSHSEATIGWKTFTFTVSTGSVKRNKEYIYLWAYNCGENIYFDNLVVEEILKIDAVSGDLTRGEVTGAGTYNVGSTVTVKALPMEGCAFDGWYENGARVANAPAVYTFTADKSRTLEARFSGTPLKRTRFVQTLEDEDTGALMENVYEIVSDSANAHSGTKSIHVLPTLIKGNDSSNRFVPLLDNVRNNLKSNTQYDVYAWVKLIKDNGTRITMSIVDSVENANGNYTDTIIKSFRKPTAEWYNAEEFDGEWMKLKICSFTLDDVKSDKIRFHLCKMNENNAPASIDEFYIDDIEIAEHKDFDENTIPERQTVDFENNRVGTTEVFKRVTASELPVNVKSNGSNGYLYADGSKVKKKPDKTSAASYDVSGLKFKSNTTYRISVDYYVAEEYSSVYHCALGYYSNNLGNGAEAKTVKFSHTEASTGWKTMSFTITTGTVKYGEKYIYIASYQDVDMFFDNVVIEEMIQINVSSENLSKGEVSGDGAYLKGNTVTVKAIPFKGCTFDGWYDKNGNRVSGIGASYTFTAAENINWVARFSGYAVKDSYFVQDFESLETGTLMDNVYEIVNDPKNARSGMQSLHVLPTIIKGNGGSNRFIPLLDNVKNKLKVDTEYDVYFWVKLVKDNNTRTFFSVVDTVENPDNPGTYTDTVIKSYMKQTKDWFKEEAWGDGVNTDGQWTRIHLCTLTLNDINSDTIRFHISKFNETTGMPSRDEFYIDDIEIVERKIDYANMKFCDRVVDMFENSNFENGNEYWGDLPNGLKIIEAPEGSPEWSLKHILHYTGMAKASVYKKTVSVKEKNYYTLAAYIKVIKAGNFSISLTTNLGNEGIRLVAGSTDMKITADEVGDWKRVSLTVETIEDVNALTLMISGTTGEVYIDNLNLFLAKRGFTEDPNVYTIKKLNVLTVNGDGTITSVDSKDTLNKLPERFSSALIVAICVTSLGILAVVAVFAVKFIRRRKKDEK